MCSRLFYCFNNGSRLYFVCTLFVSLGSSLNSLSSLQGRKEMFYLTTHSTHFIYGYMASDIWLRTILPPHRLFFPINSKGSFICTISQTG